MGTYVVKLPDVGEGIAEAEIVEWHVVVGATVSEDQPMVDVMTDKATVELPAPVTGTVAWLGAEVGDVLAVGSELIRIETADDGSPAPAPAAAPSADVAPAAPAPAPPPDGRPSALPASDTAEPLPPPVPAAPPSLRPLAAPAVRRRAIDLGIDLATIPGTGADGRVDHADLDRALLHARGGAPAVRQADPSAPGDDRVDDVKVVGLRRNIARRMQESKRRIPHFTYVESIDVTEVERLRAELNSGATEGAVKLTLLPFLMRAVVVAVRDHPEMNARFDDDAGIVRRHHAVHLGIAVQTPKGLMVPVVKNAHRLDLAASASEVLRLSDATRAGSVTLDELTGSTITITSLGALGGVVSTPVINHPEVAIIGVNKIETRPEHRDGGWVPRQVMNLSSSFDHRVIDGWDAARFVRRIKDLLETPALLFLTTST